jgi:hypothetical protein
LGWEITPQWLTAVATVLGVLAAVFTLRKLTEQTEATRHAANAARKSADTAALAERAYFDLAHDSGLTYASTATPGQFAIRVKMRVTNKGRTPATVSDAVVGFKVASRLHGQGAAYRGPYSRANKHSPWAYMVPGKSFFFIGDDTVTHAQFMGLHAGTTKLYVLGYVDYLDCFEERRRTGYARVFKPKATGNNLAFFKTAGYNYDRARERGEGKDWD